MEYISFIRLDILCVILFLSVVINSGLRNQAKVWVSTICLVLSTGIVGSIVYFDLWKLFSKGLALFQTAVYPVIVKLLGITNAYFFHVTIAFLILALILIVYLILLGLAYLFGAGSKAKYKKYPSYAKIHRPIIGVFGGIIKGAILVYFVYFAFVFIALCRGFSLSNDFAYEYISKIDPITPKLIQILNQVIGGVA